MTRRTGSSGRARAQDRRARVESGAHRKALWAGAALAFLLVVSGAAVALYLLFTSAQPTQAPVTEKPDIAPPSLISATPLNPNTVELRFSEPIASRRVVARKFRVSDGAIVKSADITESGAVRLRLGKRQSKGKTYVVQVAAAAVADASGNTNPATHTQWVGFGATGGRLKVWSANDSKNPVAKRPDEVAVVDELMLKAEGGDVIVTQLDVRSRTTAPSIFSDLVEAWLFQDNGDGVFQPDGRDLQLHRVVGFSGTAPGSPARFGDMGFGIPEGATIRVWVVYRLGNYAVDGHEIGSEIHAFDIHLGAGHLAEWDKVVSANDGRTIVIDKDAGEFTKTKLLDPSTIVATVSEPLPGDVPSSAFTVNGEPASSVEVGGDGQTVRIKTSRPIESPTVDLTYSEPTQTFAAASTPEWQTTITGPTYVPPSDTQAPTVPLNPSASAGASSPVIARVTWNSSTDNNTVRGYRVWRSTASNGTYRSIGTTPAVPFNDVSGVPGQAYYYKVSAYDPTGNESTLSAAAGPVTAPWNPQPHAAYGSGNLCVLCHESHQASTASAILRQAPSGVGETALCYECHDGSGATLNVKNGPTESFALASGHSLESKVDTTNVDLTNSCSDCHGPHQSRTTRPTLWRSTVNSRTVTGNNNSWCHACHDSTHSWWKPGTAAYTSLLASPTRDAITSYPTTGTYPGSSVATDSAKNAHADVTEAGQSEPFSCKACHDNHRGTAANDMLRYRLSPSIASSVTTDLQTGAYADMCLRCHRSGGPAGAKDIKTIVTADYNDPAAFAGHRIMSPGAKIPQGAALPCYECHNVHGSSRGNNVNFSDALGRSLTTTDGASAEQVRQFCLTCHSTNEATGQVWDATLQAYRSVRTTETVAGLRRDGGPAGSGPGGETHNWLKLKDLASADDGHSNSVADRGKSCYKCHDDDYSPGGNNVHNPGPGESGGALACGQCHEILGIFQSNTSYHHYMVNDTASSSVINPATLTASDARRNCLTCHVDHDVFSPNVNPLNTRGRAANLRASVAVAPSAATSSTYQNTDFDELTGTSVCTSCHNVGIIKNTTNRRTTITKNTYTIKMTSAAFRGSAHNYYSGTTTVTSDNSFFKPNCAKCHDDKTVSEYFTGSRQLATHDGTRSALLTDSAQAGVGEDPREAFCFVCHSRSTESSATYPSNPYATGAYTVKTGMRDVYGLRSMDATSVNVKGQFTNAAIQSGHPATSSATAQVECSNCHSVHSAGGKDSVATNPDNTLNTVADGNGIQFYTTWYAETGATKLTALRINRNFCLKCHDGLAPSASANTSSTYVPYSVIVSDQSGIPNPTRRANNKDDNQARSHYNTTDTAAATARPVNVTCADCHDTHSSTLPAMLGVPNRSTAENFTGARYIYDTAGTGHVITGNDKELCYSCHTASSTGYTTNESRNASGYPMLGRWPGSSVATVTYNTTTHVGNPHKSAGTQWPGRTEYAAGDCKNCHDPHGTTNSYDELRTENAAGTESQYLYGPGSQTFCFNCHDGSPADDIQKFYPGGSSAGTYAGHKIQSSSPSLPVNAALPCYDCHNPHGSDSPYGLQVRSLGTGAQAFNLSTAAGVRAFCFACHVSSDGQGRVNAGMVSITAGTQYFEGIDRAAGKLKLPPLAAPYVGHASGDSDSCYRCHGDGTSSTNVHNPEVKPFTLDCYGCHDVAPFNTMSYTASGTADSYHHVLGAAGVKADLNVGISNAYPTSTTNIQCISCHVGHEYFDPTRGFSGDLAASNLRSSITSSNGTDRSNSDFSTSGQNGICISCHRVRLGKDASHQRADGTTWTPVIGGSSYTASAHQYAVNATVTADNSPLKPNCSKCHNSDTASAYMTPIDGFGVHASPERNLLASLGASPPAEALAASHCLRCHAQVGDAVGRKAKTVANKDWYGAPGGAMSTISEKVWKSFNRAAPASSHPMTPTATGSLTCENCHNPHIVSRTTTATMPDNNMTPAAYSTLDDRNKYCLQCHDGGAPSYKSTDTTYVATTVTMTATWGDKKALEGASHWVANGSIRDVAITACTDCHDKHGSRWPKLVGNDDPAAANATVKGQAITGNNSTACYPCHTARGLGYPTGVATTATIAEWDGWRALTGYVSPSPSTTRTAVIWPGQATWQSSPHGLMAGNAPAVLGGKPKADCQTCHDVHGTTGNVYDELKRPYTAGNYQLCFDCHEGTYAATNIQQFYPSSMGGQNDGDNAGHRVKTAGGTYAQNTPLPCWECHLTHGSVDGNADLLSDARWNNLSDLRFNAADCREFCLGCHATEDRYVFSSALNTVTAIPASNTENLFAGMPRSPVTEFSNKLHLPHLQTGTAHLRTGTESCYDCHGSDYTSASSINVHNPSSGVSNGNRACYDCHTAYLQMEDDINGGRGKVGSGAGNKNSYHHVLGSASDDGDKAPGASTYPTSTTEVYCVSCHTDHNNFNSTKHQNLRSSATASTDGSLKASTDFLTTGDKGVCVSCHVTSLARDTTQKNDGVNQVPKIVGDSFSTSAHQYPVTSYYDSAATSFAANCSKCHDDSFDYEQDSTMPKRFGTHTSNDRKLLGPLGDAAPTDPLAERHCYRCHSVRADAIGGTLKPVDGQDWYADRAMTALAQVTLAAFRSTGSTHPVDPTASGAFVDCASCHNVHVVSATTPTVDPLNTYTPMQWTTANKTIFCLRCHDADKGPTGTISTGSFVPTSVVMPGALLDKNTLGGRGHWTAAAESAIEAGQEQTCVRCHDKHGSQYDKLVGITTGGAMSVNGLPITGNDNTVCFGCHTPASTNATTTPNRTASGYIWQGTWTGKTAWDGGYNSVEHTGSPHAQATMQWPGGSWAGGDCKQCHDVHGTANSRDMLRTTEDDVAGADIYRFTETNYSFCFNCHDGSLAGVADVKSSYPVVSGGTSGLARSGHRFETGSKAGQALPCYDCHNPHGTGDSAYVLMVTAQTGPATTVVLGDQPNELTYRPTMEPVSGGVALRQFCFACHTTGDTVKGWAGTTGYQVVAASTFFEGIDRASTEGKLRLSNIGGHKEADQDNCYKCHAPNAGQNAHNLGYGYSQGGSDCYDCHTPYRQMEDNVGAEQGSLSGNSTTYHHVLGSATEEGDKAPNTGAGPVQYPNGDANNVFCVSCHADHNYFNPPANRAANLRLSINQAASITTNTDFSGSATDDYGICVSCHDVALTKDIGGAQKVDVTDPGRFTAQVVQGGDYKNSKHRYGVRSWYDADSPSTSFYGDCAKCHGDAVPMETSARQDSTLKLGTHVSADQRLLAALGVATVPNRLGATACYRCHSLVADAIGGTKKASDTSDWYGTASMDASSTRVYKAFTLAGASASRHPVDSRLTCVNCHNVHEVTGSTRVSEPNNTVQLYTYARSDRSALAQWDKSQFCLRCHDTAAKLPQFQSTDTTFVPFSVTRSQGDLMNKATYATTSHMWTGGAVDTSEVQTCEDCHDKHGSPYPKLVGNYDGTNTKIDGYTLTGNNETVCYGCHDTNVDNLTTPLRDGTGFIIEGRWPGIAVWRDTAYNATNHTGPIHKQNSVVWPRSTNPFTGGDCKNCHDPHGTANTYDMLRVDNPDGTPGTFRYSSTNFTFCFNCHDGLPSTKDIKSLYPSTSGGTNDTAPRAGHKFVTGARAGQGLPCEECHNPHGTSNSAYGLQVNAVLDAGGTVSVLGDAVNEITFTPAKGAADVRKFCFTCHTSGNDGSGWDGAAYTIVPAGTTYLGISRTTESAGSLRLTNIGGHGTSDTSLSCYTCHGSQSAHNPSMGSGADHNADQGIGGVYTVANNEGCFGCHYADLTKEHGDQVVQSSDPDTSGAYRTMQLAGGGNYLQTSTTDDRCNVCHNDKLQNGNASLMPLGRFNESANTTVADIVNKGARSTTYGKRCDGCHYGNGTNGPRSAHSTPTTGGSTLIVTDYKNEFLNWPQGGGHGSTSNMTAPFSQTLTTVYLSGTNRKVTGSWAYVGAWTIPAPAYINGDTLGTSMVVKCSYCHQWTSANYPNGPLGAAGVITTKNNGTPFINLENGNRTTGLCADCHGGAGSGKHSSHGVRCVMCHIAIPHAWKRKSLLRRTNYGTLTVTVSDGGAGRMTNGTYTYTADVAPYAAAGAETGMVAVTPASISGGRWDSAACEQNGCKSNHAAYNSLGAANVWP